MPLLPSTMRAFVVTLSACVAATVATAQSGEMLWERANAGYGVPGGFVGGYEKGVPLIVCRGPYANGVYPGKVVNGKCNVSFDNKEVALNDYEVLVGNGGQWGGAEPGYGGAFVAGGENGGPLFLCQAPYEGGVHPGKVYNNTCHISYGGREIPVQAFSVLYLGMPSVAGAFNYPLPSPWGTMAAPSSTTFAVPQSASCTADATRYCAGCAVTCATPDAPRPECRQGVDSTFENSAFKCVQASWCYCTK